MTAAQATPDTESCGCTRAPSRLCDVCYSTERVFMACSPECLAQHQRERHPGQAELGAPERARAFGVSINARYPDNWQRYAPHRKKLMQLVERAPAGGTLAVLGAGNASDLELPWLTERFDQVHLIDWDSAALERARARHELPHSERLVLHGGVDLSGFVDRIDAWGGGLPEPAALVGEAVAAAQQLAKKLGSFDVTLSTCVLSQLGLPFRRSWVASRGTWEALSSAITSVHLATLAVTTRKLAILATDVQTTQRVPELDRFQGAGASELAAFVDARVAARAFDLTPDPRSLLEWLRAPGMAGLVAEPALEAPWLWDLGEVRQLVYALTFQRVA